MHSGLLLSRNPSWEGSQGDVPCREAPVLVIHPLAKAGSCCAECGHEEADWKRQTCIFFDSCFVEKIVISWRVLGFVLCREGSRGICRPLRPPHPFPWSERGQSSQVLAFPSSPGFCVQIGWTLGWKSKTPGLEVCWHLVRDGPEGCHRSCSLPSPCGPRQAPQSLCSSFTDLVPYLPPESGSEYHTIGKAGRVGMQRLLLFVTLQTDPSTNNSFSFWATLAIG